MSHLSRLSLFFISSILAFLLITFGLRLIFSSETIFLQLKKTYLGTEFQLDKGDFIQQKNGSIDVIGDILTDESRITLANLAINVDYYQAINIHFPEGNRENDLLVQARLSDNSYTQEVPIFKDSNEMISRLPLNTFTQTPQYIIGLTIKAPKLIKSYSLAAVDFIPKTVNYALFGKILSNDFSTLFFNKSNGLVKGGWTLISPQLLILLFFVSLMLFFGYFLYKTGYRRMSAWWAALIFTWLLLDIYFLQQQSKNNIVPLIFPSDWHDVLMLLLKLFSTWMLSSALILACLKKRYGYRIFAVGGGYILTWLVLMILEGIQQHFSWPFPPYILPCFEGAVALIILYFFRARDCCIEELRLEKSPPNLVYWSSRLLFLFIVIHVVLGSFYLQVSDIGFGKTSKIFLSTISYTDTRLNNLIISLLSYYALGCLIFGGLRYLGIYMLSSMLTIYMLISLPIWSIILSPSVGFSLLLFSMSYTFLLLSLAILLSYHDTRSWFIVLLATVILLFIAKNYYYLEDMNYLSQQVLSENENIQLFGDNIFVSLTNLLVSSRIYLILLVVLGAFIIWLMKHYRNSSHRHNILLFLAILGLFPIIFIGKFIMVNSSLTSWLISNPFLIVFTPILCLIPATVFHVVKKDRETLPII